jgi:hypothetical protein
VGCFVISIYESRIQKSESRIKTNHIVSTNVSIAIIHRHCTDGFLKIYQLRGEKYFFECAFCATGNNRNLFGLHDFVREVIIEALSAISTGERNDKP